MCDYSNIELINLILTLERLPTWQWKLICFFTLLLDFFTIFGLTEWCWMHIWWVPSHTPLLSPEDNWVARNIMWLMSPQGLEHWIWLVESSDGWWLAMQSPPKGCDRFVTVTWFILFYFSFIGCLSFFIFFSSSDCDYVWCNICWAE